MPHIGGPELILILVVLFLFFGASKLPQAGQALGLGLKNFKKAMNSSGDDEVDVTPKKGGGKEDEIKALEQKLADMKASQEKAGEKAG
jgi:sec-independent protein translocase protein TatA